MSNSNPERRESPRDAESGESRNRRNLSEISHLFLSDLRSANGHAAPRRTPPGAAAPQEPEAPSPAAFAEEPVAGSDDHDFRPDETVDLTPDEFAEMVARQFGPSSDQADGSGDGDLTPASEPEGTHPPHVSAVIGARLNGTFIRRSCQYAASLCEDVEETVGVVVVESQRLRVLAISRDAAEAAGESPEEINDVEGLRGAFNELRCDIRRWLVILPDPHLPVARRLLGRLQEWVLLATADHDGVVASYRALKELCEVHIDEEECAENHDDEQPPHINLALLDARSPAEAHRHARKLVGVCKQFLDLDISAEQAKASGSATARGPATDFAVQEVLLTPLPSPEQARAVWSVVEQALVAPSTPQSPPHTPHHATQRTPQHADPGQQQAPAIPHTDFSTKAPAVMSDSNPSLRQKSPEIDPKAIPPIARPAARSEPRMRAADAWVPAATDKEAGEPVRRQFLDELQIPDIARPAGEAGRSVVRPSDPAPAQATRPTARDDASDEVIDLPAGSGVADVVLERLDVVTTPIAPPMLQEAKLCVDREGSLLLVAAASPGLNDLGPIGRAMAWVTENRQLLSMALSQYRLSTVEVRLHLLVSHTDAGADALRPLLGTGRVSVQRYRRLTWGGRCGLLLEAA